MDNKSKTELKKLNSIALREHLKNKNWEKIEELLPAAEVFGVSNRQLQKTWFELGQQQKKADNMVSALVSFASARKHDIDNPQLFIEITECLVGFIDRFESKFSREDLVILEYSFNRIITFYKSRLKRYESYLFPAEGLLNRIKSLIIFSPSKKETPASSHVQRIYAALYPSNMPIEEIRVEFGRLFAATYRDEYERRVREKKKQKKKPSSTGGKKPPKKGDSDPTEDDDKKKPPKE